MIELLIGIISVVCGLVITMMAEEKRQQHKRKEGIRAYIKSHNRSLRLSKWKKLAIKWKEELKKPMKVQFT